MKKYFFPLLIFSVYNSSATVWQVGPSHPYTMPSQVSTFVQNGDTVDIDSGNYPSDVCRWQAHNLLLRGIGGFAHLESNGLSWGDKAIWVIQGNNVRVEWIEFSECTSTSQNGAGIRQEGLNLTVSHCYFHNNEDGILGEAYSPCKITIEFSEFAYNGYGDGYSHNLYIGHVDTLVFQFNYSHHCHIGHELKSRASVNYILYNRISNEATGDASREIDLPNGGLAFIIGNEIEQGPNSQNSNIIGFGMEGLSNPGPHQLFVVNNTFVNDRSTGNFLSVMSGTSLLKEYNNIFAGPGTIISGSVAVVDSSNNFYSTVTGAGFLNAAAYNYHLLSSSGAIDGGTDPGVAGSFSLSPVSEYVHPAGVTNRISNAQLDIGAHEFTTASGIENYSNHKSELFIFPNPNNGCFSIAANDEVESVIIFDSAYKIIFEFPGLAEKISSVCLDGIPGGVYFIAAKSGIEITDKRKVIIQR